MAKYLRDIGFRNQPLSEGQSYSLAPSLNFLEMLYFDCLPKLQTNGVSKVVVRPCVNSEEQSLEILVHPDIIQISKVFDFDAYECANKESKKLIALNFLHDAMVAVAKSCGWDPALLNQAYQQSILRGLVYRNPWTKAVSSPDKKSKAQVWCSVDSDKADIYIYHLRGAELVGEHLVTSVKPGVLWINDVVGTMRWKSPNTVSLISRDKSRTWDVVLEK